MKLDADKVRQFQRAVGAKADGVFGPATLNLGLAWIAAHGGTEAPEPITPAQPPTGLADPRSEGVLATLHPQVQQPFRDLLHAINAAVAPAVGKWISGYRGEAEQNALYAKGRTAPGPRVTSAPWPTSSHNGGGGKAGFHSGADFGDRPHICLRPPSLRAMSETAFINALIYRVNNGLAVWP